MWARRKFAVTPEQANSLAVLRWNHIDYGAVAFINGQKVGANEPTGPYQVMVPVGVLRPGENEIVLKATGGSAVRTDAKNRKYMLIPAGFATRNPVGMPTVLDDVWLDFAHGAYMRSVLALPDVKHSKVAFRVVPEGLAAQEGLTVRAEVRSWPDGKLIGQGETAATVVTDPDPLAPKFCTVEVPMPHFKAWTPEDRNLYTATLRLAQGGRLLDKMQVRFGMREIKAEDGRFKLNGRDLWLRGSDLVGEWNWPGTWLPGHEKEYLVDESRVMNMNSFRTHTLPQPASWSDLGDENGIMFLTEFRLLFNGANPKFTPEEYEIFHHNCLLDAAGWIDYLGNHPSVLVWVLSNESYSDPVWESGPYRDLVRSLDPSRPTMRTDQDTAEIKDLHPCSNTEDTDGEGSLFASIPKWQEDAKGRVLTNTEYMNGFGRPVTQWTGTTDKQADALAYAQLGLEHTEAMRRARFAGLWPFMYAGWTKTRHGGAAWHSPYAQPISAALHSGLSPVLASLDLFNADYLVNQQVTSNLYLINDSWHDAKIHVDLLLTSDNPQCLPDAACFANPLARQQFDFTVPADSIRSVPVEWKLPATPGQYWLTARTTGLPGDAVLSQRFVRANAAPKAARTPRVILLGGDTDGRATSSTVAASKSFTAPSTTGAPGSRP